MAERSIAESAKQRSLRVPLQHFRRADALLRAKWVLSAVAAVLACGYVAWLLFGGRAGARQVSPGQVTDVHAAWNDDCQSCHVSFRPLSAGAVDLPSLAGIGPSAASAAHRALVDQACEKCHAVAAHGRNLVADQIGSCASCHREHRGAAADIVRPADSACTRCHANIGAHRTASRFPDRPFENVSRFSPGAAGSASGHPAFRSLAADPGNLKFNHWLHMQPGIAPAGARQPLLDASDKPVQLSCESCHVPDDAGAYMRPVSFDQHCRKCHPLSIAAAQKDAPPLVVKHGLAPQELAAALDGLLWDEQRRGLPPSEPTLDESGAAPLVPGKTLGANLAQKLGGDLLVRRQKAELALAARCQQCHDPAAAGPPSGLFAFKKTSVNSRWFQSARFDHAAHRHVADCRDCHQDAYEFENRARPQRIEIPGSPLPAGTIAATDEAKVMIADVDKCAACHSPSPTGKSPARHDCAECHSYHNAHLPAAAAPPAPPIKPVSWQAASAAANAPLAHLASCAAAGCHGDAQAGAPQWRSSFATWLARDPHVHAAGVLETQRARQMTGLVSPSERHEDVLVARCLNCHATDRQFTPAGVHCDSCHGNSSQWLHTHSVGKPAATVRSLDARAQTCLPCHVGPAGSGETAQVVDHDLIAAGHPRLSFEFHAYFESLPAHWSREKDEATRGARFHSQTWLAGQRQHAAQHAVLTSFFTNPLNEADREFSLLDCTSCHHTLAAGRSSSGELRPLRFPLEPGNANTTALERVKALLLQSVRSDAGFDDAVAAYLAARALVADFKGHTKADDLRAALAELGRFLGRDCFGAIGGRLPTPYDAPQRFDRAPLAQRIQAVSAALDQLNQP